MCICEKMVLKQCVLIDAKRFFSIIGTFCCKFFSSIIGTFYCKCSERCKYVRFKTSPFWRCQSYSRAPLWRPPYSQIRYMGTWTRTFPRSLPRAPTVPLPTTVFYPNKRSWVLCRWVFRIKNWWVWNCIQLHIWGTDWLAEHPAKKQHCPKLSEASSAGYRLSSRTGIIRAPGGVADGVGRTGSAVGRHYLVLSRKIQGQLSSRGLSLNLHARLAYFCSISQAERALEVLLSNLDMVASLFNEAKARVKQNVTEAREINDKDLCSDLVELAEQIRLRTLPYTAIPSKTTFHCGEVPGALSLSIHSALVDILSVLNALDTMQTPQFD